MNTPGSRLEGKGDLQGGTTYHDLFPNFKTHQIFTDFPRPGISFSCKGNQTRSVTRHHMRIHRQFWLHSRKDCPRLFRRCVMRDDDSNPFWAEGRVLCTEGIGVDHFMNQYIGSFGEPDQIFGESRVAGEHDGVPRIVDPVSEYGFDWAMIDDKCSDLHFAALVYNPLVNVLRRDDSALCGQFFVYVSPNVDVELIGPFQMRHHLLSPGRPPHPERNLASLNPSSQPEVRNAHCVVGVQVGKK